MSTVVRERGEAWNAKSRWVSAIVRPRRDKRSPSADDAKELRKRFLHGCFWYRKQVPPTAGSVRAHIERQTTPLVLVIHVREV